MHNQKEELQVFMRKGGREEERRRGGEEGRGGGEERRRGGWRGRSRININHRTYKRVIKKSKGGRHGDKGGAETKCTERKARGIGE